MKAWPLAMLCAAVALSGCRTDPNIGILERELRQQEDRIYQLQFALEDSQRALEQCRQGRGPCKPGEAIEAAPSATAPTNGAPARRDNGSGPPAQVAPPEVELPNTPGQSTPPESLRSPAPKASPAPKFVPPGNQPAPKFVPPGGDRGPNNATQSSYQRSSAPVSPPREVNSAQVHSILLNRALTGGYRPTSRPIDEGVSIFIELRDRAGQPVYASGPVSVVLLDRQEQGEAARVARWDFTADEVAAHFSQAMDGQGIHLELPWPSAPPTHDRLQAYVRYTTADGRKLEAHQAIEVQLSSPTAQWSPSSPASLPVPRAPAEIAAPDAAPPSEQPEPAAPSMPDRTAGRPSWSPYR